MYYCLICRKVHPPKGGSGETVFKTGFHYIGAVKYTVGLCEVRSEMSKQVKAV